MVDGFRRLVPAARLGHIGLYREHMTLEPVCYYSKLPHEIAEAVVILLDPMLATGGSASLAFTALKKEGARILKMVSIVGAPEGIGRLEKDHPDVDLFLAALDEGLDRSGYILPGLGDAGDRLYGTNCS
jgi:uracil phosphoribosyltransferase